jgi:hypothetical protein
MTKCECKEVLKLKATVRKLRRENRELRGYYNLAYRPARGPYLEVIEYFGDGKASVGAGGGSSGNSGEGQKC